MTPAIRARFVKVRALAQNGATPGERQAAQARLDEMTAKYGDPDARGSGYHTMSGRRAASVIFDDFAFPGDQKVEDIMEMVAEVLRRHRDQSYTRAYNDQRYRENSAHADRMAAEERIRRRAAERNAEAEHARRQRSDAISAREFLSKKGFDLSDQDDQFIIDFARIHGWRGE